MFRKDMIDRKFKKLLKEAIERCLPCKVCKPRPGGVITVEDVRHPYCRCGRNLNVN